jgi:hypothetical protein
VDDGAVGDVAARYAAREEANPGCEVEEARVHGVGEVEEWVDDVADGAEEAILVQG